MSRKKIIIAIVLAFVIVGCLFAVILLKNKQVKASNIASNIFVNQETTSDLEVVSFISPHHLVADKLIDGIFREVSDKNFGKKIDRIILMSPDHFNKESGWGFVSDHEWRLKNGTVYPDKEGIKKIVENTFIREEDGLVQGDHGITAILPYIEKYFPAIKTVPILLKNELPREKADQLVKFINNLEGNSLLIISSDFSHYLEKNIAEMHDREAISTIKNFSFDDVYGLETDFVSGLYVAMRYAQLAGYEKFRLIDNSSSSKIAGKNFIGENTSYVTGYFERVDDVKIEESANILFLGDLMLDRNIREIIGRKGGDWMTKKIERLFWSQDLNVVNLEGPITKNNSVAVGTKEDEKNHFVFTFDPADAKDFLEKNRISAVNIGNNHILNFGEKGLEETKNNLKNCGVEYFGDPQDAKNFLVKEINGRKIGLVNYNQFSGIKIEETADAISELEDQVDFVIVYTHWGTEYQLTQNKSQEEKAHRFIDAGADIVVGSHSHVVQPLEIYQGKLIFYSLGNFIFDQYFSEDTKTMLAVGVSISDNNMEVALVPLYQGRNGQLELADEYRRQGLLKRLAENSKVDNFVKNEIMEGRIEITNFQL